MAEQVKSFIRKTITPLASFVLFDVLNVNYFLGYLGLALETLEEDRQQSLELETKRKIEAEEVRQRKKIKPSEDLANIESEEARDEEEERPGSRQKLWNLKPEINFTESLQVKVNFSGPKKYIAPTESFEGDILKDVNDVDAEEAMGTVSDVVFVSNVDVVNNPYHFESVTQYVVIPNPSEASLQSDVEREEALSEEVVAIEDDVMKNGIESKPASLPRLIESNPDIEADAINPSGNPNPNLNEDEPVREVESNKHDDDTVLITTQDLTKLVKDNYSIDDPQDDAILITTQDLDAILNDGIKSNEGESEASVIAQAEENSKDEITGIDSNVNPDINEGIMNVGISSKETSDAIIDDILNINRKQSEIVDVESDENEETPEDQDVEDVPHAVTDPNGSVESAGSLEVGMEAGEDAFVVIDEASDLLTDKTNMIIPKSQGNSDDKAQVISVAGDKENKTEGKKKSSGGRKGKNKKKVF